MSGAFPPVTAEMATPDQLALLERLPAAGIGAYLIHVPALAEHLLMVGAQLMDSQSSHLPEDLREAIILRTAAVRSVPYIQRQHRRVAEAVGVTVEAVEAALLGSDAPDLPAAWRAPLALIEHALTNEPIAREDREVVVAQYGHAGAVACLITSGFYSMLAMMILALDIQLE